LRVLRGYVGEDIFKLFLYLLFTVNKRLNWHRATVLLCIMLILRYWNLFYITAMLLPVLTYLKYCLLLVRLKNQIRVGYWRRSVRRLLSVPRPMVVSRKLSKIDL